MDQHFVRTAGTLALLSTALSAGCIPTDDQRTNIDAQLFKIEAKTVECVGIIPMRCLVINDELFYDTIEGYTHVEGKSAEIYVESRMRNEPIPADAGIYLYRVVQD